jgi:hypothetical protein
MTDLQQEITKASTKAATSRKTSKRIQLWLLITSVLLAVSVAVIVALLHNAENRADVSGAQVVTEQEEKKEIANQAQKALCQEGDKLVFDRELCEYWATVAQEPPVQLPEVANNGPTQAELILAFRAYCDAGNCRGEDGETPTPDDIAAAFVKFCANDRCTGPEGKPGEAAEPLAPEFEMVLAAVTQYCASGACVGPSGAGGANATQDMVLAAVQAVCANDACRGEKGDDGEKGEKGDPPTVIHVIDPAGRPQTCTPNPPGSTEYYCTWDEKPGPTLPIEPPTGGTP